MIILNQIKDAKKITEQEKEQRSVRKDHRKKEMETSKETILFCSFILCICSFENTIGITQPLSFILCQRPPLLSVFSW